MIPWLLVPPAVVSRTQGGGKAFHLARLAGLPIPPWLVVTPGAVVDGRLDGAVAAALTAALPRLGPGPYAVRSSAVAEDGAAGAFAGQLASYLDVPAPGVAAAVVEVVHSACGLGVWRYAQRLGLAPPAQVAVVVQAMVSARVAGVAFGVDPTRETRDALAIAAAPGTGQGLVGGAVSGDYYRLSAAGETLSLEISGPAPVLNEAERRAVLALLHKVEAQSAVPQDIEWALDQAGDLWLLQARPVTALPEAGDLAPGVVWDNANIVESYPGVTSPLTFSFIRRGYAQVYRRLFRLLGVPKGRLAALEGVFAGLLGYLHGRVYYQLLHWYRLVALLPGFATNRRALEQMMGLADALTEAQVAALAPATRRAGLWDRLVLARAAAGLGVQALLLPWTAARFTRRLAGALGPPPAPWPRLDAHQLVAHYRHLEGQLLGRWDAPLVNDLLCMITCGVARGVLKGWLGEDGDLWFQRWTAGAAAEVAAEPARRIRALGASIRHDPDAVAALVAGDSGVLDRHPALARGVVEYLAVFGERCVQELKLESATLGDDPTPLLRAVGQAAGGRWDAAPGTGTPGAVDGAAWRRALPHPGKRWLARGLLALAAGRIRQREHLRLARTRVFARVRRVFLELGQRLTQRGLLPHPRAVFYLEVDEVLGAVEGTVTTRDLARLAAQRQAEVEAHAAADPLPPRLETRGPVLAALGERSQERVAPPEAPAGADLDARRGLGCSPGRVVAPVAVVVDPRRQTPRPGAVVVASATDPGWVPLLAVAGGLIVERGSPLSHAAIVAREMNLPAVVGVRDATRWLTDGEVVTLDGASGWVRRGNHG